MAAGARASCPHRPAFPIQPGRRPGLQPGLPPSVAQGVDLGGCESVVAGHAGAGPQIHHHRPHRGRLQQNGWSLVGGRCSLVGGAAPRWLLVSGWWLVVGGSCPAAQPHLCCSLFVDRWSAAQPKKSLSCFPVFPVFLLRFLGCSFVSFPPRAGKRVFRSEPSPSFPPVSTEWIAPPPDFCEAGPR